MPIQRDTTSGLTHQHRSRLAHCGAHRRVPSIASSPISEFSDSSGYGEAVPSITTVLESGHCKRHCWTSSGHTKNRAVRRGMNNLDIGGLS